MTLQFVLGNSGSGKTEHIYREIVGKAGENPKKNYLVIVPEQFTMQTQKKLVELAPNHAIMNIDVLSFKRLAYRVFDELGKSELVVLEETGKNLVLRKLAKERQEQLTVLRPNMSRMGYVGELKSLISEFMQYNITPGQLENYIESNALPGAFASKLRDIVIMYRGFLEYMEGSYITAEEILNLLIPLAKDSPLLRDSVVVLDEFTGFTPIQNQLLRELFKVTEQMYVLLTIDAKENFYQCTGEHELFYLTKKTIASLRQMAEELHVDIPAPIVLGGGDKNPRFQGAWDLSFMEQNLFRAWYRRSGEIPENIHISTEKNPREELTWVAREINRLVRQEAYRYRDMAVVCGAVDTYGNYVEEVFGKYGIPCFLDETTEILFHPFIELIRAAFEVLARDYSYDAVMRFLRCGFTGIADEELDLLDNYLLATGIRGRTAWHKRWLRLPREQRMFEIEQMEGLRQRICALFSPLEQVFQKKSPRAGEAVLALYQMLVSMNTQEQLWEKEKEFLTAGQQAKSKEYGQIYAIVMELLEKYNRLLGEEVMDVEAFAEVLDAGLSAAKVAALPPGYDSVTIGDMERTRLNHIRILFFVGVNDGIIPKSLNSGGIISEYEREMLQQAHMELAPGARERAFIQRFYLYRNLTKPSEKLYLSYARVDAEGKAIRPSYLIGVLHRIFPKLQIWEVEDIQKEPDYSSPEASMDYLVAGAKGEDWYGLARYFREYSTGEEKRRIENLLRAPYSCYEAEPISRAVAQALYGRTLKTSVTRLEKFAACAYAHFLQYGLLLREREVSAFENVDLGNLYHLALERYSRRLTESEYDWFTVPDEVRDAWAVTSMQEAVLAYPNLSVCATEENSYMTVRMENIFRQTVWALTKQVQKGKFVPREFEVDFLQMSGAGALKMELGRDEKLQLLGRIDRLDMCWGEENIYVKVIDYKSGRTKFDLIHIYQGLSLQLAVYMNAAMGQAREEYPHSQVECGGILYYNIDDPVLEEKEDSGDEGELEERLLAALRPDGLINSKEEIYRSLDTDFEGKSLVIPVELKKSGELSEARSHVADSEEFQILEEYVSATIKRQGKRIFAGEVAVNPYQEKGTGSCSFCPYGGVCGLDGRIPGYNFRSPEQLAKEEVFERMRTELALEKAGSKKE